MGTKKKGAALLLPTFLLGCLSGNLLLAAIEQLHGRGGSAVATNPRVLFEASDISSSSSSIFPLGDLPLDGDSSNKALDLGGGGSLVFHFSPSNSESSSSSSLQPLHTNNNNEETENKNTTAPLQVMFFDDGISKQQQYLGSQNQNNHQRARYLGKVINKAKKRAKKAIKKTKNTGKESGQTVVGINSLQDQINSLVKFRDFLEDLPTDLAGSLFDPMEVDLDQIMDSLQDLENITDSIADSVDDLMNITTSESNRRALQQVVPATTTNSRARALQTITTVDLSLWEDIIDDVRSFLDGQALQITDVSDVIKGLVFNIQSLANNAQDLLDTAALGNL